MPFDKIELLADILQVTPSWLMGWDFNVLSTEEKIFLEKYNTLDEMGRHTINVVLDLELNKDKKINR